jgi:Protein of unknown function (DUF1571)
MAARLIWWLSHAPIGPRRRWVWANAFILVMVTAALAGLSWWLTEPLGEPSSYVEVAAAPALTPAPMPEPDPGAVRREIPPPWPEGRLEGDTAKTFLLDTLRAVEARLEKVDGYTATLRKKERINGALGPEQVMSMKVRHNPFAVYFKFLAPHEGKEVVYAEGHHENKVIAHAGGLARLLVPRLAVPPTHPLALADSRHAITEAGLANLTKRLIGFRRMDLEDAEAVTVLDRATDFNGRSWLRSIHTHPHYHSDRPFARVEVLYDPETCIPLRISNYDWPAPDHTGDLLLAERYVYEDLDLDADLTALDFDPANPEYAFHRY